MNYKFTKEVVIQVAKGCVHYALNNSHSPFMYSQIYLKLINLLNDMYYKYELLSLAHLHYIRMKLISQFNTMYRMTIDEYIDRYYR